MSKGLFSIIVALYGVEDYVETFLRSLLRQTYRFEDLEVVIVDDGSTDRSYEIVKEWAQRYPEVIRHTTKENGGPASARNIGIAMAQNEWVTFCDPDDALQADYFASVADFLDRDMNNRTAMLTTRVMIWQEETSKVSDTHPLAAKYRAGDKLVNLNFDPNYVQLGGATTFLRRSVLLANDLRFDERIRPTFEDAELIGRYLGKFDEPIVGLVSKARYLYRKRGNGSSLVQSSWGRLERYIDVPRYGYLGLLQGLHEQLGYVPRWAQNMVLYDIQWYLTEDKKMHSASAWLPADSLSEFHSLLIKIFSYIDLQAIREYNLTPLSWITRTAMLVHFKGRGMRLQPVVVWKNKPEEVKVGFGYSGVLPPEEFEVDGRSVAAVRTKSVAHIFYGKVFFYERMVWLPHNGKINVRLNTEPVELESPRPPAWNPKKDRSPSLGLQPAKPRPTMGDKLARRLPRTKFVPVLAEAVTKAETISKKLNNRVQIEQIVSGAHAPGAVVNIGQRVLMRRYSKMQETRGRTADAKVISFATSETSRQKYQNAWLIMDRRDAADDNGEHLYRYIMKERPDINAWFMLDRSSPDWKRLNEEGFRLVATDSNDAVALTLNAAFKISSDATFDVQFPVPPKRFGTGNGRVIFLQHGVTKDDLSRWLNPKPISMIVTATVPEFESIAADDSPYRYTAAETKLTGFPRYDELLRKAQQSPVSKRPFVLVMPTWRQDLKFALEKCSTHTERLKVFESSIYGQSWLELLRSEVLKDSAAKAGLEVVYVLHPSMTDLVGDIKLPPHIRTVSPVDVSLQDLFAQTRVTITDYSSIAFDVALAGASVIYYQFDAEEIFNGRHNYRRGYYDYASDGFGPVAYDFAMLSELLSDGSDGDFMPLSRYTRKVTDTFAFVDTDNCKRVVDAICSL